MPRALFSHGSRHGDRGLGGSEHLDLLVDREGFVTPQGQHDQQNHGQHDEHAAAQHRSGSLDAVVIRFYTTTGDPAHVWMGEVLTVFPEVGG
ncbi:hypothetical protein D9M68_983480 [compost metagenome]